MSFLAIVTVHTSTQVDLISFIPSYFHSLHDTHMATLILIVYLYIQAINLLENCLVDLIKKFYKRSEQVRTYISSLKFRRNEHMNKLKLFSKANYFHMLEQFGFFSKTTDDNLLWNS